MNTKTYGPQERDFDWIFSKARAYPLLEKNEEFAIDSEKWESLDGIFRLLLENSTGRHNLELWADNLLHNPPDLTRFEQREHYYLLRREHAPILNRPANEDILQAIARGRFDQLQDKRQREQFLSGSLVPLGFGSLLTETQQSNIVEAALLYWQQFWQTRPMSAGRLPPIAEKSLVAALDNYHDAREKLVNHNLRLVFSIARKLEGKQSFSDLIQDGLVGLLRAAEKFDSAKGYRFSTYAYNWIVQSCRRGDESMGAIIRYPSNVKEQITAIVKERASLVNATNAQPSRRLLASRLNIDLCELESLMTLGNLSVSTESKIGGQDSNLSLGETLVGELCESPDIEAGKSSLNRLIQERLQSLKPLEKQVITRRWGLDNSPPSSRKLIATELSVSTEWIRQVEAAALAKLRDDSVLQQAHQDFTTH